MQNNLPYPVWENNNLNYHYQEYDINKNSFEVTNHSLLDSLSNLAGISLYYSFNHKYNNKFQHDHAHSFEEVVDILYLHPVSFFLSKEDKKYYNKSELMYLKYLQKYLLFIGRTDLDKITPGSCNNPLVDTLSKCSGYYTCSRRQCKLILSGRLSETFTIASINYDIKSSERILRTNNGDILGIIEITPTKYKRLDELNNKDLNYKQLGYKDLDTFKRYINDNYNTKDIIICINNINVIEKFKERSEI